MSQHVERKFEGSLPLIGEDGRRLNVSLYINYTVMRGLSGSEARLPGSYSLELDDGSTVEKLDDDSFRVDETGEILRLEI